MITAACELLGGGVYDPEIDPDDFVEGIDHPYFRFPERTSFVYQKLKGDGLEELRVGNTGKTIEILGVECTVVRDTETLDGSWLAGVDLAKPGIGLVMEFDPGNGETLELVDIETH